MAKKYLVLLSNKENADRLINGAKSASKNNQLIFIAMNKDTEHLLKRRNLPYRKAEDYCKKDKMGSIDKVAIDWINNLPDVKLEGGKSVKEFLGYGGRSLWWYMLPAIYYDVWKALEAIESVLNIFKAERPEGAIGIYFKGLFHFSRMLKDDALLIEKTAYFVAQSMNISFVGIAPKPSYLITYNLISFAYTRYQKLCIILNDLLKGVLYRVLWATKKVYTRGKNKILILTSYIYWGKRYNIGGNGVVKGDRVVGNIMERLSEDTANELTGVSVYYAGFIASFKIFLEQVFSKKYTWKPFEYFYDFNAGKAAGKMRNKILDYYKTLQGDGNFREALFYEDIDMMQLLKKRFSYIFFSYLPQVIKYIEGMKNMLKKENPSLVCIVYEAGPYGRAAISVAFDKGVPTVAIQHGDIQPSQADYNIRDVAPDLKTRPYSCPIPTKTLVYSPYSKQVLTGVGSYPEESVIIAGMPSTDILIKKEIFKKDLLCKKFGVSLDKKVILWIAGRRGMDRDYFNAVLEAQSQLNGLEWIVKMHPVYTIKEFVKMAKEKNANIKIIRDANIYELLFLSNVILTMSSTAGLEALCMGKPLVIMNLSTHPDYVPYVREKAARGVYNPKDLIPTLKMALNDQENYRKSLNIEDFIAQHAYKVDGKVNDRMVEAILSLIS